MFEPQRVTHGKNSFTSDKTMEKLTKKEKKEIKKQEKLEYQKELDKQQRNKKLLYWVGIPLLLAVSVVGLIKLASNSSSTPQQTYTNIPPISKTDIATGNPNSKVKLIEYADFQCPSCAAVYPLLKQLLKDENGKIYFIYRFFPLTPIHKNAMAAAKAGYSAYLQGKFWQMHDVLFEHQNDWAETDNAADIFVGYAKQLGLDVKKFQADMNSDTTQKFITAEEDAGTAAGIAHTPTLLLNGVEIQPSNYTDLKTQVDAALTKP